MKYNLNKLIINITWSIFGLSFHTVFADGTETPVTPSINISTGVGVITSGTGLVTKPTTIDITIPDSAVIKSVLLYLEGQHFSPAGDDKILFDDILVTGTLIRGPEIWYEEENTDEIELIYTICTDNPKMNQKTTAVLFETFTGEGTGRFNCVEGATINFMLVDQGEPGKSDTGWIQIFYKHEQEVLNVEGCMKYGNLLAHN